jgi:hypothetical protein
MARAEVPPEQILAGAPPHLVAIARELRRIVTAADRELTEHGYPGWRAIAYRHPEAGYVCGVFLQSDNVRLLFEYGRQLPDPAGILAEGGSQTKWVSFRDIDAIVEEAIAGLVEAAIAFGVINKGRLSEFRGARRGA